MNTRYCLTILAAFCFAVFGSQAVAAEKPPRPDILLIMPDQMRGDCLSVLGHKAVRTPSMDKLATGGALFQRAYATVPSCIPSRYAFLTGLHPQTSGVVGFQAKPITCLTFPQSLTDAGYATVLVGREMHQVPESKLCGYQRQILTSYVDGDYNDALKKSAPKSGGMVNLVKEMGLNMNGWQAKPWPLAEDLHPTNWIVSHARQTLAKIPAEQPLFLTASFHGPHPPLFPPKKYFDAYLQKELPRPAHGDWVDWKSLPPPGDDASDRVLLEGKTLHEAQAGYFGLIEQLGDQITPLIAEFKARSEKSGRPWLIVFTADHGEMLGDHGYFRKCEPYQGSANIPLLIAGSPELGFRPGVRCFRPVCLEDIMPTLVELAGGKLPAEMDGVSLVPTLRGEKQEIRPWLQLEHAPCYNDEQAFHALTDGRIKYIWRPAKGTEQLFDLDADLREEHDLSKDAAHHALLEEWRNRLIHCLANRPEGFSDGRKLIPGRPYPPLQKKP